MSNNPSAPANETSVPQLAREIIDSILETPDALELMFGGSAAAIGSDVPPGTTDALEYEKHVFVEDSQLKQLPLNSDVFCQG